MGTQAEACLTLPKKTKPKTDELELSIRQTDRINVLFLMQRIKIRCKLYI